VPGEVARLVGPAIACGDHQAGVLPGLPGIVLPVCLSLGLELERGHADRRQRERGVRSGCLGFPMVELVAEALELPAHIDLGGIEVDICPWQSEDFAQAQAEDQHQHVPGVPRVVIGPR
jgi:hypothetical protein